MKKTNDLGQDSIFPLVCKLAIPTMIAQLVNVLYSIIDRMFIGNIPVIGDLALAGAGVCGPIVTLLSSFGTLVGLGGSILMAMRLGEKKEKEAQNILNNSFLMLVVLSLTLTIGFLLSKDALLVRFGASQLTFPYADTYLTIYTFGTFFALLGIGMNYFITCQGFPLISMATVITGAISNIILDAVFIFVFDLGIAGAALATVLSQMLSCCLTLLFLFKPGKYRPFKSKPQISIAFGNYSLKLAKKILALGFSPFVILSTDSLIIIVMNAALQQYGGSANGDQLVSAATIIQSYMLLITGPMVGITGGTQAIISYNYGAVNTKRVKQAEKNILALTVCFSTIMFLVSRFLPQAFVHIFTSDVELIKLSTWGIRVFTLGIIPLSFQYVFVDGLTALGRTKTALTLSILRKSLYMIFTMVIPIFYQTKSAFYAEPLSDVLCSCLSTIVFLLVFSKHLHFRESAFSCNDSLHTP